MSAVVLDDVTKVFGHGPLAVKAVDDVTLEVESGELVVVMGPSGSGKTTLLQLIGALATPTTGEIRIGGESLARLGHGARAELRLREIGFVFQAFNLLGALDALDNVALPAAMAGVSRRERRDRAATLLEQLGLSDRLHHRPDQLSGGEQQRVAVARALVNDPPVLLADEPTANLDAASGYQVLHLLEDIADTRDKTILMVTHDHRVTDVADRLLWLADGKLRDREADFATVADPVCGMEIVAERAAGTREVEARVWHFCSRICLDKFDRDPSRYVDRPSG